MTLPISKRKKLMGITPAKKQALDMIGRQLGVERKVTKLLFGLIRIKESDKKYKARLKDAIRPRGLFGAWY